MYHRYLNIPMEHLKPACFNETPNQAKVIFVEAQYIDQNIKKWIESFGVKVSNVTEGIYTPPADGKVNIHNDTKTLSNATKINFTWGPNTSVTRWWRVKDKSMLQVDITDSTHIMNAVNPDIADHFDNNNLHSELTCAEQHCVMMHEAVIDKPSLINVGQLHSTYNPHKTEGRWSLCYFLLNQDYTHLQFENAVNIFKEVAYE